MEHKLKIEERLAIHGLLPSSGFDYTTGLLIKDLRSRIDITEEETDKIELVHIPKENGGTYIQWNKKLAEDVVIEVKFSKAELAFIRGKLKELNDKKQLTENLMDIYEKFAL